jgi:hypothetical protein
VKKGRLQFGEHWRGTFAVGDNLICGNILKIENRSVYLYTAATESIARRSIALSTAITRRIGVDHMNLKGGLFFCLLE